MNQGTLYTIYKATNTVNGKIYIGFDSNWPTRIKQHEQAAYWNVAAAKHLIHSAIRKYGTAAFTWECIYMSRDRDHSLQVMEEYFIREYNSHYIDGYGYNMTYGGQGNKGYQFTEEHRRKIREGNLGRVVSLEGRTKMASADRTKSSGEWELTSPDGESIKVVNLAKWARENGFKKQALLRVHYGGRSHCRGWKVRQLRGQYQV